ncbi:sigma-E processing peptidase SpoIIGA [Clostridium aestuarii]|uniref:Sigma-E processing peptidase SpoIIGA n=1 Tax=Clostridium aestuarii TaxID=338193 RepID=A0ABT4D1K0_9CLOT|nr:sigma-E processing peptidase SpoIIGA [Clostridium aestuarii]MCY6484030.1 sigma-E processing peptidase SpoIIGA [Clostridium aestuarii]
MIVYLDIFIIENFIVNLFLLYITAQTLKVNTKLLYKILASIIGTLYAVISVYTKFKYLFYIPIKLAVAVSMVIICFKKSNFLFNFKASLLFILYSMLLAGLCLFIELNSTIKIKMNFDTFSYKGLLASIMITYILIHRISVYIRGRRQLGNLIYDVDIVVNKDKKKVRAFLDTGNELTEPATSLPVIIVEKNIFKDMDFNIKNKFFIPYKVINGCCGKLEGFKPKYIRIYMEDRFEDRQVIVAFCDNQLSTLNDYNALLSRGIL